MNVLTIPAHTATRCPDKCVGATHRQRALSAVELRHISVEARREISASRGRGFICEYCGCVYVKDGHVTRRLGVLIGGWHSALYPRDADPRNALKQL
jgi:hypothetical protein